MKEGRWKSKKKDYIIAIILIVVLLIPLVLTLLLGFTAKFATPDDLKLTISSDKETVDITQNESFIVNIKLTNVADDHLLIHYDFSVNGLLEFKIILPSNRPMYPIHPHINFTEKYNVGNTTLLKSESINTIVDIFDYEYSFYRNSINSNQHDWDETGKYKIQFEYVNWRNESEIIKSNIIEFEIV
jgi:hypothetical protein